VKLLNGILIGTGLIWLFNRIGIASIASSLNFRIGGLGFSGGNPVITLVAQNPQSAGFAVNSIVGDVYINGTLMGNLSMFQQVMITPVSEVALPLTVRVNWLGLPGFITDVLQNGWKAGMTVNIKGNANVETTIVPLNLTFVS
jgi:LEA14-like dessication related protein